MTWLRHSSRHLHATVTQYLEAQLHTLGWDVTGGVPFGADPVSFVEVWPQDWQSISRLASGSVSISVGDEPAVAEQELGGHLVQQDMPIFVDMYCAKASQAMALACDVRDIFLGRLPGSSRVAALKDFRTDPATDVPGWQIEFIDVIREVPGSLSPLWQVVKATAECTFNEVVPA